MDIISGLSRARSIPMPTGGGLILSRSLQVGAAVTDPTQALVNSFAGTGLLDALLVFDPAHYSAPGSTPGMLVDALGGPITYTAANTQATPSVVADSSGYYYASADGIDDTLIASANQTVRWYCAVFRSPPGQTVWSNYGGVLQNLTSGDRVGGIFRIGNTDLYLDGASSPRGVGRNGATLVAPYDLSPITDWMVMTVAARISGNQLLQMFALEGIFWCRLHLAALAIRYTDPTSDQQTQIEAKLAPVRDALLATA